MEQNAKQHSCHREYRIIHQRKWITWPDNSTGMAETVLIAEPSYNCCIVIIFIGQKLAAFTQSALTLVLHSIQQVILVPILHLKNLVLLSMKTFDLPHLKHCQTCQTNCCNSICYGVRPALSLQHHEKSRDMHVSDLSYHFILYS